MVVTQLFRERLTRLMVNNIMFYPMLELYISLQKVNNIIDFEEEKEAFFKCLFLFFVLNTKVFLLS